MGKVTVHEEQGLRTILVTKQMAVAGRAISDTENRLVDLI